MAPYTHHELFPLADDTTEYRLLGTDHVAATKFNGSAMLKVEPAALTQLAAEAFRDVSHLLRPAHLRQLAAILDDGEASDNDRFVAWELLKNANISAAGILPMCQDTGTAIIMAKKGQRVWTDADDEAALAEGILRTYTDTNLRYSQVAPLSMYLETNTGNNLPAQIDIYAVPGDEYKFLFQETPATLNPERMTAFLDEKIRSLGTAACPPYHLAVVIGGTSAEMNLKTVKLASCHYLDGLPTAGNEFGQAFRDLEMENEILEISRRNGIGAQFGGKYFCHDVRVVRLPRHGASLPVGLGVSCSADRQILGKITAKGIHLERLETDPAKYMPEVDEAELAGRVVEIDLDASMDDIRKTLSRYPVKTRLSLNGTMIVARDAAHARIAARLDEGEPMPDYMQNHMVYYAGPAKTPAGYASGSFGPTTAGRMDSYVERFQAAGGSYVMLAKGNRSRQVTDACKTHGGFYLGSVGGPAARLALDCIRKVEVVEYPELGMEAVWRIEVENFPAFIVVDDKGNDFFANPK